MKLLLYNQIYVYSPQGCAEGPYPAFMVRGPADVKGGRFCSVSAKSKSISPVVQLLEDRTQFQSLIQSWLITSMCTTHFGGVLHNNAVNVQVGVQSWVYTVIVWREVFNTRTLR